MLQFPITQIKFLYIFIFLLYALIGIYIKGGLAMKNFTLGIIHTIYGVICSVLFLIQTGKIILWNFVVDYEYTDGFQTAWEIILTIILIISVILIILNMKREDKSKQNSVIYTILCIFEIITIIGIIALNALNIFSFLFILLGIILMFKSKKSPSSPVQN